MSTERREPGEDELLPPPPEPPDIVWGRPPPDTDPSPHYEVPSHRPAQPMRQLDSEDGPPPRRGGPTG
ncbi:hypothetical protein [Amycolatopsis sp. DG1A-15b]|uniref:hypothetical protein n=1 Tax=Amycolatopsis sp. DG1A-15b TaxID=3052846 RepID=UPI00255BCDC5|nr:hypothetical protein [Amycolatopsis sp. DG1A-15b]WIX87732.1 hypothetical protein QRY02_42450 [Amycolatopsis sp. DG1A-15b]